MSPTDQDSYSRQHSDCKLNCLLTSFVPSSVEEDLVFVYPGHGLLLMWGSILCCRLAVSCHTALMKHYLNYKPVKVYVLKEACSSLVLFLRLTVGPVIRYCKLMLVTKTKFFMAIWQMTKSNNTTRKIMKLPNSSTACQVTASR